MNEYHLMKLVAREIPRGKTSNGQFCPFCSGGRHGERSMSITHRADGVCLFICHRDSCRRSGRVLLNGTVVASPNEHHLPEFKPRIYSNPTRSLNKEEIQMLEDKYHLTYKETNYYQLALDEKDNRIIIKIEGPEKQHRGHIAYAVPGQPFQGQKCMSYKVLDEPFCGWFYSETTDPRILVLVEDTFSAMRVARQYLAVALLGTNISQDNMFEIAKYGDNIVLALDRDAKSRALEYQQRYKFICPQMRVALIEKDLKYESDVRIKELLN